MLLFQIAGLVLLMGIPAYLHAVVKFAGIVQAEHPEWIDRRGTLSFFYDGMPRIAGPNVGNAVLGIVFSSRWRTLHSPLAATYIRRIRILLPLLMAVFVGLVIAIVILKP